MRVTVLSRVLLLIVVAAVIATSAPGQYHEKLYVLSSKSDDMMVIDVKTNRIIKRIKVGEHPHGIAAPKSHKVLYVATEGDRGLAVVDTVKDEVIKTHNILGDRPNEIEVTSDGRYVYVPALGDGVYEVFDTKTEKIIARIPTDGFPHNVVVSPDDRYMYLSPYDRGRLTVEQAKEQGLPTALNKKVYVVDTRTHKVSATIHTGNTPRPIALSPDGNRLYVNTDDFLGFLVLDVKKHKLLHTVPYDLTEEEKMVRSRSHGIGVTPDQKEVWSTDTAHSLVHVFDITQEPPKQIARLETGKTPYWLTFTPDGRTIYIANTGDDTVSVFDVAAKKEKTRINVGAGKSPKRMLVLRVPRNGTPVSGSSGP
jgi:YVTN family beta-propeller protein